MKVLFASWPAYGHLLPMLPLIRAAQQGGHDVVVSSGSDMSSLIDRLGIERHGSGVTLAESYARLPDHATISELPPEEQSAFAARNLFGAGGVDRARDVHDLLQSWRADLVIHDTLELGSPTAASMRGIPHVTHGYGPTVPRTGVFAAAIGSAISDAGLPDPIAEVFAAPYVDICPASVRGPEPTAWTDVRPLRPSAGEVEAHGGGRLDLSELSGRDVIYVTLGTIMNQTPAVFRGVIDGCLQWPVDVVVTTGPGFDESLLGPVPSAVHVAPFHPQAAILPLCTAVVSHAGAGTMLGALCHGLPQLCIPQGTDQPSNTAALLPTGAALALQPDEITSSSVAEAVGRLLDEPSFRSSAGRIREEIERMPTAGTVLDGLVV